MNLPWQKRRESDIPFSKFCHANAEHKRARLFPLPVGLSSRQCCLLSIPLITCRNIEYTFQQKSFQKYKSSNRCTAAKRNLVLGDINKSNLVEYAVLKYISVFLQVLCKWPCPNNKGFKIIIFNYKQYMGFFSLKC